MSCFLITSEGEDTKGIFFSCTYFCSTYREEYNTAWYNHSLNFHWQYVLLAAHSVWKFLRCKLCCIENWFSRHESLEAHSCRWQTVMNSSPSMIPVCNCVQVRHQHRDSHIEFLHIISLSHACLFLCQVTCRKRLKRSSMKKRKLLKCCCAEISA